MSLTGAFDSRVFFTVDRHVAPWFDGYKKIPRVVSVSERSLGVRV